MRVSAIVLAAGRGVRFGSGAGKLLSKIRKRPLFVYSLEELSRHHLISDIIVVVNSANREKITRQLRRRGLAKVSKIVLGGRRRQDSVYNGLKALDDETKLVLIHDSARPFIDRELISSVVNMARRSGAAIVGVPVKATIKTVSRRSYLVSRKCVVKETLDRRRLWEIQTPQVFRKDKLIRAYQRFSGLDVTDDSSLVEKLGMKVSIVMGSYRNIKITTPEDLEIAKAIEKKMG